MNGRIWATWMLATLGLAQEPPRPQSLNNLPVTATPKPAPTPPGPKPPPPKPLSDPEPLPPAPSVAPIPSETRGTLRAEPLSHGLRYRLQVLLRGETHPLELHFKLLPTPARTTGNKVQQRRLGGWRLETERGQGSQLIPAWVLARAERLLYLSGPSPELQKEPWALTFGKQTCALWSVPIPASLKASAYLVEIAPNLLALCDLHARFDRGDIASLNLQLEAFGWQRGTSPPENGTALLGSLQRWAQQGGGSGETERVE